MYPTFFAYDSDYERRSFKNLWTECVQRMAEFYDFVLLYILLQSSDSLSIFGSKFIQFEFSKISFWIVKLEKNYRIIFLELRFLKF